MHGFTSFYSSPAYKMAGINPVMQMTEGVRIIFSPGEPIFVCVGRDEHLFYFQELNGE